MARQRGSITVFSILVLSIVLGCLLSLLEGSRMYELHRIARLRTELALEAAFANYNTVLWKTYHLLGCDETEMQSLIITSANGGYSEYQFGSNLLMLKLKDVDLGSYTLLTDGGGKAYIQAVSSYMKENILYETAKGLYNQYESIKNLLDSDSSDGTEIDKALESLEELEKEAQGTSKNSSAKTEDENVLESVQRMQRTQGLGLVVKDTSQLSELEFDKAKAVSERELQVGVNPKVGEVEWMDRVLLQQYLLTYFADYTNPLTNRGLSYELEYLIGGRDNDVENLKVVVDYLFMIREAANFVYLLTDVEKVQQAYLLAVTLAGATVNPVIVEVVKLGLIAAWAYAESVLDVRGLLQGKQIPFIKSKDTWTLALENIGSIAQDYAVAKESKLGLSYRTYLGALLLFQGDTELAYRAMDMQELTLQKASGSVQMDQLVIDAQAELVYEYAPIFMSLHTIKPTSKWKYQIQTKEGYGYY